MLIAGSAAARGQGDEELPAAGVDARGHRHPGHQPGEPVDQPVGRLLGVLLAGTTSDQLTSALAFEPIGVALPRICAALSETRVVDPAIK